MPPVPMLTSADLEELLALAELEPYRALTLRMAFQHYGPTPEFLATLRTCLQEAVTESLLAQAAGRFAALAEQEFLGLLESMDRIDAAPPDTKTPPDMGGASQYIPPEAGI